jgi:hypothetical protein
MSHITRIVIALNADGTHKGSAVYEAEEVAGRIFDLDPRPIAADDAAALSAALTAPHTAALAAVDAHLATIAARDASIATLTGERDSALARVAELEAALALSQADDLPSAIRAERDRRIVAGVKLGEHWYHSDLQMQIQVLGMVIMGANLPSHAKIKTLDDGPQPATPLLAQQLFQAIATQQATLHAIADAAIANGTALADVPWPPTYSG